MRRYAKCLECEKRGKPSGFHEVYVEGNILYINCSTCGKMVLRLTLAGDGGNIESKARTQ